MDLHGMDLTIGLLLVQSVPHFINKNKGNFLQILTFDIRTFPTQISESISRNVTISLPKTVIGNIKLAFFLKSTRA